MPNKWLNINRTTGRKEVLARPAAAAVLAVLIGAIVQLDPLLISKAGAQPLTTSDIDNLRKNIFGKWQGTINWSWVQKLYGGNTQYFTSKARVTLNIDENGAVAGELVGNQTQKLELPATKPPCQSDTVNPGTLHAQVKGKYSAEQRTLSLIIVEPQFNKPEITSCPTVKPGVAGNIQADPWFATVIQNVPRTGTGFDFHADQNTTRSIRTTGFTETLQISITLRPCHDGTSGAISRIYGVNSEFFPACDSCPNGQWKLTTFLEPELHLRLNLPLAMSDEIKKSICLASVYGIFGDHAGFFCLQHLFDKVPGLVQCTITTRHAWKCSETGDVVERTTTEKCPEISNHGPDQ